MMEVGGRGWTVTFTAPLPDRKDEGKKEREKLLFWSKKRSPGQVSDLQSSL